MKQTIQYCVESNRSHRWETVVHCLGPMLTLQTSSWLVHCVTHMRPGSLELQIWPNSETWGSHINPFTDQREIWHVTATWQYAILCKISPSSVNPVAPAGPETANCTKFGILLVALHELGSNFVWDSEPTACSSTSNLTRIGALCYLWGPETSNLTDFEIFGALLSFSPIRKKSAMRQWMWDVLLYR